MKKILFTLALFCTAGFSASAQWINSLTVSPANPTTLTDIHIIAEVSFPSGNCNEVSMSQSVNGSSINLSALHCVGILTFICSATDTFHLNNLPAGTYTAYFQLDMGASPAPCTPGINPGPMDSVTFTVTTPTGVPEVNKDAFTLYPNPGKSGCTLRMNGYASGLVNVLDLQGKLVYKNLPVESGSFLDLSKLAPGSYLVELYNGEQLVGRKNWVRSAE